MTKLEFLFSLQNKLLGFDQKDVEERLRFYSEMIEDRMEDGLSEEEAVAEVGNVDEISIQIASDLGTVMDNKELRKTKNTKSIWKNVLLILGAPVWFSLLIAVFAVVFSAWISIWAVIISLWAVFAAVAACMFGGFVAGIVFIATGKTPSGFVMLSAGLICAGLAIYLFFGCTIASKAYGILTKKMMLCLKHSISKREDV